ncbi:MAG: hypothetical protein V7723_07530 [Sneathiella sp.]|uniref:hypothetical protein n=1 Tax=Sneathiella sp. TaxID=1964365 RepID=UPI003001B00C
MKKLILIIAMVSLVGCTRAILANEHGVTYDRVGIAKRAKVAVAAEKHCQKYDKHAILISDAGSVGALGMLSFKCE